MDDALDYGQNKWQAMEWSKFSVYRIREKEKRKEMEEDKKRICSWYSRKKICFLWSAHDYFIIPQIRMKQANERIYLERLICWRWQFNLCCVYILFHIDICQLFDALEFIRFRSRHIDNNLDFSAFSCLSALFASTNFHRNSARNEK